MDVSDAATGKSWHRATEIEYIPRPASTNGYTAYAWDGTTTAGKKAYLVPSGQYVIELSVLKPLGDDSNPAHWETWTSPPITIQR